ncbi:uncharacterized protein LOC114360928 [Ostrinia furnacalis]|uniref:uncharacterized protein LOC114360928 n=1 Tax=Ostrinia furnacalis TaxID=93504 RepID=UPI0010399925|nr:uncharacterized protein LOC114360928 [Ostrinia furnacalis]
MTPMQKRQAITKLNYCANCLCSHYGKNCTSSSRCRECDGNHNTLLHEAFRKFNNPITRTGIQGSSSQPTNTYTAQQGESSEVLLATAIIQVAGVDGVSRKMRALIDPGSQISIITENAAQQLRLPRQKCSGVITGVGTKDTNCKGKITIHCSSLIENFAFTTEALIMNKLTNNLPNYTFKKPDWKYLNKLSLADPEFFISRPIDILLGADIYASILMEEIRKPNNTQPVAQRTQLGWILYGKTTTTLQCNVVLNNIEDIQRFWEIEEISSEPSQSNDDQECIDFYKTTTTRRNDGKYQVRLPLKKDIHELGQSRNKAIAQFLQLERKFKANPKVETEYKMFMHEYQDLGHMQKANCKTTPEYFLPHHCVLRESTTTSLRVVFNASQNTSNGKSLNDYMHKGPNLQQDLFALILKWRQYYIAFTADIEKMFRQIWIHPDDLKFQKIIWRDFPNQAIEEYELTSVTYGTKAAPFLAMMTLRQLAEDERQNYPEAAEIVKTSFYMDDLLQGSHSLENAIKIKQELIELLKKGGFNLRKWTSNHQDLLQDKQNDTKQDEYDFKHLTSTKTLGLRWDPEQDMFIFQSMIDNPTDNINNTKRKLLSDLSKLFDPLGWLTPISTKLKLLFQQVWEQDIPWDAKIPDNINIEWIKLKQDLININKIQIPRWLGTKPDTDIELHGFCDASQNAYACVIYCKLSSDTETKIILVVAKSKIVPRNKDISLPRKELIGAHLLSQLMQKVEQCLTNYKVSLYAWTDSTAVLGWIQGNPDRWKTFVSNRVRKITTVLPAEHWRYVKSADNPADCASRGITPSQLLQHSLWWQGPAWLSSFKDEKTEQETYFTNEESRNNTQVNLTTQSTEQESIIKDLLQKYSSLSRVIRILGWVRRFISGGKRKRESYLTLEELKNAKIAIIKQTQAETYQDEIVYEQESSMNTLSSK